MPNADNADSFAPSDAAAWRARLHFDAARLLAECEVHLHRTGGPGGQHRNKVASAVRLVHRPTGFTVTAGERRSQHENRANAVERLRAVIAIGVRCPLPRPFAWPPGVQVRGGTLRISERNAAYAEVLAWGLDALHEAEGQAAKAAARLGISTSSLTRLLAGHPQAWAETNRIRARFGLAALKA